jgi:hypothetical protein
LVSDDDAGEDKLEAGAKREGKSAWDIAKFYTEDFRLDFVILRSLFTMITWLQQLIISKSKLIL